MESFAKVLLGVPKKIRRTPGVGPRILIPVDSCAIVLGKLGIAIVGAAAGQGCELLSWTGRQQGQAGRTPGLVGNLFKLRKTRVPESSGRMLFFWPSPMPVTQKVFGRLNPLITELGFVNLWKVNSLKGISTRPNNAPRLAFSSSSGQATWRRDREERN